MAQRYGAKYDWIVAGEIALGPVDSRIDFGSGLSITGGAIRCLENNGFGISLDSQGTWIVNTQIVLSSITTSRGLITFRDGGTEQCQLYYNQVGGIYKLQFARGNAFSGGTTVATSTVPITANVLHDLEIKVVIDNSVGSAEVRVDGEVVLTFSGDTQVTANATASDILFGYYTNANGAIDFYHVYIMDGTGGDHDTFVGPLKATTCRATGAGNYAQFTPSAGSNYQNIDDTTQDGDTTYNAGILTNKDSFVINDVPSGATSIVGVSKFWWAKRDDALARAVAPLWRISSTDYTGTGQTLAASYSAFRAQYGNSPATATAWGLSEFNGAESGYEVTL